MRSEPGRLGDDDGVQVADFVAALAREPDRARHEERAVGPFPGGIGIGELLAQGAEAGGAEDGVRDGVQEGVSVGVALEAMRVGDLDSPEPQDAALREGMRVEADPDALDPGLIGRGSSGWLRRSPGLPAS